MKKPLMGQKRLGLVFLAILALLPNSLAQICLLGDNPPYANMNDGDFELVKGWWRQSKQSPYWKTFNVKGPGEYRMGIHYGTLCSTNDLGIAESRVLDTNPEYQHPRAGDVLNWSFGADKEYISQGSMSLCLVFGEHERIVAERVRLIGSDKKVEHFQGTYTLTEEDAASGFPFVRVYFYSEDAIKIFLAYVNISVDVEAFQGPSLKAEEHETGILLSWEDVHARDSSKFHIYRQFRKNDPYVKLGETRNRQFLDENLITGVNYSYVLTRVDEKESGASNKVKMAKMDEIAPLAPGQLDAEVEDAEINLSWKESGDKDVAFYRIYRGDAEGANLQEIARNVKGTHYVDFTPAKGIKNTYHVYAYDFSGNRSEQYASLKAKVKTVKGASFSDLILPMPIHRTLSADTWGADGVVPRDVDNGIEDPAWSYWGGRPVKDRDGRYHMLVTRWPENGTKGHWEWPRSTVCYAVSDQATGPYKVKRERAYEFADGLGHNPDIILLNNGTYLLYSLIEWKPTLFASDSMSGPWERLGIMKLDTASALAVYNEIYPFERNLSGVQLENGRFLFVAKNGATMKSEGMDPLGPYTVVNSAVKGNKIIPESYRNSVYEDPVLWKDEVQFHMIINAFHDYRAIYLRSGDGIHWTFNPGTAYTPNNTWYEDGTQTRWEKLERPHVICDEYGRATHLSLAVIDSPKAADLAGDKHSSKNIILPLVKHKRLELLNKEAVHARTKSIKILIYSEEDFDAQKDLDVNSLRFGSAEEVDYGRGCKAIKTRRKGRNLMVEFDGAGNGIDADDFACKLLGRAKSGELIIGYTKVSAKYPDI